MLNDLFVDGGLASPCKLGNEATYTRLLHHKCITVDRTDTRCTAADMYLHTQNAYHGNFQGLLNMSTVEPQATGPTCLALMEGCQLRFHVNVFCLTVEGILEGFLVSAPDLQQQRPVCGEAVDKCLEDLAVGIQYQVGRCKAAPARLSVGSLQPAISAV